MAAAQQGDGPKSSGTKPNASPESAGGNRVSATLVILIIVLLAGFAGYIATEQAQWNAWQSKFTLWWADLSERLPMPGAGDAGPRPVHKAAEIPQTVTSSQESGFADYTPAVEVVDPDFGVTPQTDSRAPRQSLAETIPQPGDTIVADAPSVTQLSEDSLPTGDDGVIRMEPVSPKNERMELPRTKSLPAEDQILLVEFAFDSKDLATDSRDILDRAVELMARSGDSSAVITGYSDNKGAEDYNLSLSYKRAGAVAQYLTSRGIGLDRLQVEGRGASQDFTSASSAGLAVEYGERRIVEIKISTAAEQ